MRLQEEEKLESVEAALSKSVEVPFIPINTPSL
jgi:hypothetical protein